MLPEGYLAMSRDIFGCHNLGDVTGIEQLEVSDPAKHLQMHWIIPSHDKELFGQSINSTKVEKLCSNLFSNQNVQLVVP